jgi:uncharacterized membrane protein YkoI
MRRSIIATVVGLAAASGATGVAFAGGGASGTGTSGAGSSAPASRLDDGKALLPKATITEQQAIAAAQGAASGALNEVDLEYYQGRLVFNVDVGSHDVKVDAAHGDVLGSPQDDTGGN